MFTNNIFQDLINKYNLIQGYDDDNVPIFKPEDDDGYIEYKLRLDRIDDAKKDRMVTQMKHRLIEGKSLIGKDVAYYLIGIDDDGTTGYISKSVVEKSINVLEEIVKRSNAEIYAKEIALIQKNNNSSKHDTYIAAIYIRKSCNIAYINEFRIIFLGSSGFGKTTCISYLTYNEKDNGNGSSRMVIFKHSHEQNNGITSSIKHDIFGLKKNQDHSYTINNYRTNGFLSWDKIVNESNMIISLFDSPGCPKYLKTTYFGITALKCNMYIVTVSLSQSVFVSNETLQAIEMSIVFDVPILLLFTKLDIASNNILNETVELINSSLKQFTNKQLIFVDSFTNFDLNIPYIAISNVTGENYDKVVKFIDIVSRSKIDKQVFNKINKLDFMIYDVINIRDIGYIVTGIVLSGEIRVDDSLLIGPIDNEFYRIIIKTIRKKQIECDIIHTGETGTIEIKFIDQEPNYDIDKHVNIFSELPELSSKIYIESNKMDKLQINHQYTIFFDNQIESVILSKKYNNIGLFNFVKIKKIYIRNDSKVIIKNNLYSDTIIFGTTIDCYSN